jgi:integrase
MRQGRVFRRGKTWSYIVDVSSPGGPRRQQTKGGFPTRGAALEALHALQHNVVTGYYAVPSKVTLATYLTEIWLPAVRGSVRPGTWTSYESYIRLYVMPRLGAVPVQSLTRAQLRLFYADLETDGRTRGSGGLSRKTVHNVHVTLLKALGDAVEDQLLARNPAVRGHRLGVDHADVTTWSSEDVARFLTHVRDDRLFALWRLASLTGMRRGELCGLRWRDVDLANRQLAVAQQRLKGNGTTYFAAPKTRRSSRTISLDAATVDALHRHRVAQARERLAAGETYDDHGLVFCLPTGVPLDPDGLTQRFNRHVRESRLPRIRLHDLRHTHATLGLSANVHPKIMQERLGHATVAFTLDIYSHAVPTLQQDAAAKLAAVIDGHP